MIHPVTIAEIPDPMRYNNLAIEVAELISQSVYMGGELPRDILDSIEKDFVTTTVAIDNTARTVGAATFWLCDRSVYIGEMGVDASARNQGIGRQIVDRIEYLGRRQGAKAAMLVPISASADKFWEHMGYSDDGEYFVKQLSQ